MKQLTRKTIQKERESGELQISVRVYASLVGKEMLQTAAM